VKVYQKKDAIAWIWFECDRALFGLKGKSAIVMPLTIK